ncbi:MAG: hypothetical protein WC631_03055 [Candidatus Paceibacterota bacterium]|jgi:hypothetical protein
MTKDDAENSKSINVYKKQEFESYVLWRSMPSILRGQPRHVIEKLGIDDEIAMSLLDIKNQTEFAKHFGIKDLGTLTEWNKRINENGGLMKDIVDWAKKLTPNVISALYREATKSGRAAEIKAWMEIIEGM